jgi:hypothetical protein
MNEPGTIAYGSGGTLHVMVDAEHYRIDPEDAKALLFSGRAATALGTGTNPAAMFAPLHPICTRKTGKVQIWKTPFPEAILVLKYSTKRSVQVLR